MSLFKKLLNLFNKNIECDVDMNNHIVFFLKKKKYLYINKNIIVRDGTMCVIVYKKRVCDVLLPGKYKMNEQCLPIIFDRAKVEKFNNKGKKIKRLRVQYYFVNTQEKTCFDFNSTNSFVLKTKECGKIKGSFKGTCVLRVIDSEKLIKSLIHETGVAKNNYSQNKISNWIGNKINKKIQKEKVTLDMIFNNLHTLNALLNTSLEDAYDNIGIYVKNIKLKAIDFKKKHQKKINEYLATHKKIFSTSTITNANWQVKNNQGMVRKVGVGINTMQNGQNRPNVNSFKVCNICGCKNDSHTCICRNCGGRI